jgi:hypothetical protein
MMGGYDKQVGPDSDRLQQQAPEHQATDERSGNAGLPDHHDDS